MTLLLRTYLNNMIIIIRVRLITTCTFFLILFCMLAFLFLISIKSMQNEVVSEVSALSALL